MFRLTLLSLLFVGGNTYQNGDSDCKGKSHGPHADNLDTNCNRYYFCLPGNNKQVFDCSEANRKNASIPVMFFNPSRKICTTQYECPGLMSKVAIGKKCDNVRLYEQEADTDDKTCKSYYICTQDFYTGVINVFKYVCDDNKRFDPKSKQCTQKYKCPALEDENSKDCIDKPKGPHADKKDCKKYYFCMAGNRKESFECKPINSIPLNFDPVKQICSSSYKCFPNENTQNSTNDGQKNLGNKKAASLLLSPPQGGPQNFVQYVYENSKNMYGYPPQNSPPFNSYGQNPTSFNAMNGLKSYNNPMGNPPPPPMNNSTNYNQPMRNQPPPPMNGPTNYNHPMGTQLLPPLNGRPTNYNFPMGNQPPPPMNGPTNYNYPMRNQPPPPMNGPTNYNQPMENQPPRRPYNI